MLAGRDSHSRCMFASPAWGASPKPTRLTAYLIYWSRIPRNMALDTGSHFQQSRCKGVPITIGSTGYITYYTSWPNTVLEWHPEGSETILSKNGGPSSRDAFYTLTKGLCKLLCLQLENTRIQELGGGSSSDPA